MAIYNEEDRRYLNLAEESGLKKRFESILGPEIDLNLKLEVAISTYTQQAGTITSRRVDVVIDEEIRPERQPSNHGICRT